MIVVAGPTASGKSALALQVAKAVGAEIISADSQAVYRHFDLGTAKPTAADQAQVPHHLVSVVDPGDVFSAARFAALADAAIADIQSRGRRVVVVGGTGLYLKVLLKGVVVAPSADRQLRARLEAFADAEGNAALWKRLEVVDPTSAAKLNPADRVRVIRALEIFELTGATASAARASHGFAEVRHPHTLWVLNPPRETLYAAINARTRAMYAAGLVDEVRALVKAGYEDAAPMRSVGYVEALSVLKGERTLEEAIALTAQRTRNFAKRQLTWFLKEPGAQLLEPPWDVERISGARSASAGHHR